MADASRPERCPIRRSASTSIISRLALGSGQAVETTLLLSQLIELGGKRDARVAAALGDYDAARYEREATRLELLSETDVAFIGALAAQRRIGCSIAMSRRWNGWCR